MPSFRGICTACGKIVQRTPTSRPEITCQDCRRERPRKPGQDPPVRERTAARGYGKRHQAERERLLAEWQPGDPCAQCGGPMWGMPIDLGHTADRSGWTGLEHRRCNRSEGARRGNRTRRLEMAS